MTIFLPGYDSFQRIAKVHKVYTVTEEKPKASQYERINLFADKVEFASDKYCLKTAMNEKLNTLVEGDIITINNKGIVRRIFSATDNDVTIYVTGHCNSNCVMCPSPDAERMYGDGLTDELLFSYIDMLPSTVRHIVVTGGEPTLRTSAFLKIISRIADRFPQVETLLLTNGRSFASAKLVTAFLSRCSPLICVGIPIHGHNALLHDSITQAKGSFEQTCAGIVQLLVHKVTVELRIVVSLMNYRYLTDIAQLIVDNFKEVFVVNFVGLETSGNCARNFKDVYIEHVKAFQYIKPAIKILLAAGIDTGIYNFPLCAVEDGYWGLCKKSITPEKIRFTETCATCIVKKYCGGFFSTTLLMAKPQVYPITSNENRG